MQADYDEIAQILGRRRTLFGEDLQSNEGELSARISGRSFLVLGGAGSIGQAVVEEIFKRRPRRLHVVDLSENNLAELVRHLRSTYGYIDGDFRTLALDCGSREFTAYLHAVDPFDVVLNFSAMKHVRSERDAFTLMRMVRSNIANTRKTLDLAIETGVDQYFSVSSDKAVNPTNAMGASKRIMEIFLAHAGERIRVSSARFANVAFSDGSLLHAFTRRLVRKQPLAGPDDVRRYFITPREAAILSLMACTFGETRECYVPAISNLEPVGFRELAGAFLAHHGYSAYDCQSEEEARNRVDELASSGAWPCYFTAGDTTGEKALEEFQRSEESLDRQRYREIGVIRWPTSARDESDLARFLESTESMLRSGHWSREDILREMEALVPEFQHRETGKFLDARM